MPKKILFICGSLNQTTMMHQISSFLSEYECWFSPFYAEGVLGWIAQAGLLNFSILGGRHRKNTEKYLVANHLPIDFGGRMQAYDAVVTCTDTIIQRNIRGKRLVLVQEGLMEPEGLTYQIVRRLKFARWLANTAATGLSDAYDLFCVASAGFRDLFVRKGVNPNKMIVTGIPNFDNIEAYRQNDFPYKDYVLVTTTCSRETFKPDNRHAFIEQAIRIAGNRQMIFKLHPNEDPVRSIREIKMQAPNALIFTDGNVNHMIANCSCLVSEYSSVVFIGIALGKEVHSFFDLEQIRNLTPIQNGGSSAQRIAELTRQLIHLPQAELAAVRAGYKPRVAWKQPYAA